MSQTNRILIVDTLRGFALLLIVLIHFVEHFDFFREPQVHFLFSAKTDSKVMEIVFLLISGKAYSVFALLFGFSFFIQLDRKAQKGIDFRATFLWRLFVLMIMGFVHSLIYRGDILHIYAILGIPLLLLFKANTKVLLVFSGLLLLQIPFIWQLIQSFQNADYQITQRIPTYWGEGNEAYANGTLKEVIDYNLWKGRISVWSWTVYNGRLFQLFALYIIGLVIGRERIFEKVNKYSKSIVYTLLISITCFFLLRIIQHQLELKDFNGTQQNLITLILNSYINLTITSFLLCSIVLLYIRFENGYIFKLFASYGKMSLSNYVFQAVAGVFLFYGFGLALFKYLGSTWSVIMGVAMFFIQAIVSNRWNKIFYYGPLEWLWRAFTFMDFKIPFRKISIHQQNLK